MELKFEVHGVKEFHRSFQSRREALKDLRPVWPAVTRAFRKITREQFASEGAQGREGQWQALSEPYATWKKRKYGNKKILVRTGRLRDSLIKETADTVLYEGKEVYQIGSSVPYGGFHQAGGHKLPKRKIIDFTDDQRTYITKKMQAEIVRAIRVEQAGII